jgi:hypothetical protein
VNLRNSCRISLLVVFACTAAFSQVEFSADVFNMSGGTKQTTKIFVGEDKLRVESGQTGDQSAPEILDLNTRSARLVVADRKTYMQAPDGMSLQRGYAFFRAENADSACAQWQKLVLLPGSSCRAVGQATIDGRTAQEYEGKSPEGDLTHVWMDSKLNFPIKWDGKNGGGELHNINEASQPASLFEIPSDYKKIEGLSTTHHHAH